ncbi:PepSY domain-containing protein [Bacillus sp. SD088]|uniref:PepSY domain-containing protein n=1 Tax=Bacillus sp. SD088 TaxID=2782012 RepID=UPI001A9764DA|nr:PepSY domain-containing protein [Bacillus sp. SD088]MBO0995139.1 PepSY domain-containing protein [Bacillus sp. SD088]
MMRRKSLKPLIILICIGVLTFAIWQLFQYKTSVEPITEADAENIVNDIYKAESTKVTSTTKGFLVTIELKTGIYEIEVDRQSGDILEINRVKAIDPKPDKETPGKKEEDENKTEDSNVIITKEKALEIALNEVEGEVDDIDFEEENGVSYYFIEIERSDGMEATIQINAVTGEVKTTTWDD